MSLINPHIKYRLQTQQSEVKPIDYYINGIVHARDLYVLSEGITLLESDQEDHRLLSLQLLSACYPHRVDSFRYGITGSPGVGKSTFIDSIVGHYVDDGHQVGILTVDPSSTDGKGSILGDKTRMEDLAKNKSIFIRPSPSNRYLGGLNQYTYEAIILCEAAGINRIFVETVGIGQSEVDVSHHTDATILLVLPGSGDSLQGIKKGILEKADLVIIHKSDGAAKELSNSSAKDLREALHYKRKGKNIEVIKYSSITEENKSAVMKALNKIEIEKSATILSSRKKQEQAWLHNSILAHLVESISMKLENPKINSALSNRLDNTSPFTSLSYLKDRLDIQLNLIDDEKNNS